MVDQPDGTTPTSPTRSTEIRDLPPSATPDGAAPDVKGGAIEAIDPCWQPATRKEAIVVPKPRPTI